MLTAVIGSVVSALLVVGIWRIFLGSRRRDEDTRPIIFVEVSADYETLRRFGAELRAQAEIERLERMVR